MEELRAAGRILGTWGLVILVAALVSVAIAGVLGE